MSPSFMRFLLAACFLCAADLAVSAQEPPPPRQTNHEAPAPEECRAEPEGQGGIDQGKDAAEHDTAILERCKGVLKPPPTGDSEMVAPAPHVGTTPVIPPDSVPDQPPVPDHL